MVDFIPCSSCAEELDVLTEAAQLFGEELDLNVIISHLCGGCLNALYNQLQ